jgi:DNA-directed RNA polymerase specialized sigma24 family protein
MSAVDNALRSAPLPRVAERCAEETGHYFSAQTSDTSPCFELFRRALAEGNQLAWEAVFRQYHRLVAAWVGRHPERLRGRGEIDDYVNNAFERMWSALSPAKFARFGSLGAVLAYLKMCAHSAVMEDARRASLLGGALALDDTPSGLESTLPAPAAAAPERVALALEVRHAVREAVNARLLDEKERLVVHCLFELDLKPKAICARHPDVFDGVREVYLIRQVVLERLSRDSALKRLAAEET